MDILRKIFGIEKCGNHKVITILGIKIKFNREMFIFERILCFFMHKFIKVKKNKIVICNLNNRQYACNPKYIADELQNHKSLDIVWLYSKNTNTELIPKSFRLVKYKSIRALYELMSAKVWIFNNHMFLPYKEGLKKPKDTIYIQTWHGSMGIKKFEADAQNTFKKLGWYDLQYHSASDFDYILVDSNFEQKVYKTGFWGFGNVIKIGKARDCIFYKNPEAYINKVKEYYNIPKENKICLYAPTWRSNERYDYYNIDIKLLQRVLKQKFGGEWSILIRSHYHMDQKMFNALYGHVLNATDYIDMQELLVAADVLISDYSSCIPEYTILKKPSFIYATDIEEYDQGFYYPLSTLPTPIATDNGELAENILNFDNDKFVARCNEFLQEMGHKDDENSCKRIVDFILEKMGE